MEFTKKDLIQLDNLVKIIKRGQYSLDGLEVLATAECMKWVGELQRVATFEVHEKENPLPPPAPEQPKPKKEKKIEPKPVEPEKK